jgi:hypothetical protein
MTQKKILLLAQSALERIIHFERFNSALDADKVGNSEKMIKYFAEDLIEVNKLIEENNQKEEIV